ncbi:MAG TPA: Uma2 family endonuclease [Longimicrobium sp.]|nr:Uma2 family endonuclease [Longimicrobium sp.]
MLAHPGRPSPGLLVRLCQTRLRSDVPRSKRRAALTRYTPEEYLALERNAEFKNEYIDGRIIAMTGASPEHADVVLNVGSELRARLRPRGCRVFVNDMRVQVAHGAGYMYPDVVAVCEKAAFLDTRPQTLLNPSLVIEVLSNSSESFDRAAKFAAYRGVESLSEYVLIDSRAISVERYVRHGEFWMFSAESGLDATLELSSVGCTVTLREIYADVQFPGADADEGG